MLRVIMVLGLATTLSACGLASTIVNSEANLDRLSVSMSKEQVIDEIGNPDMVLRDHAGITIWQYSMATRQQWLYELSLCPVSIFLGGCVFYPFTNSVAEYNREHPVHVVLVKDQLCAWGSPLVVMKKRRSCGGGVVPSVADEGFDEYPVQADAVVTTSGPINAETIEQYESLAVLQFTDAPDAEGSGARVSALVATLLLDLGLNLVERAQLDQLFSEQALQLQHSEDEDAVRVGQLGGAEAVVLGEIGRWEVLNEDGTAEVSLALRMIDVQTGRHLFGGTGHFRHPMTGSPEHLARLLVHRILARFAVRTGLLGTGRIGVKWTLHERARGSAYVVEKVRDGSPAEAAGLKTGDVVLACNGSWLETVQTERQAKRACRVDAGETLTLRVDRDGEPVVLDATAEARPEL